MIFARNSSARSPEHQALLFQDGGIDGDPVEFHLGQHLDQRRLEIIAEFANLRHVPQLFVQRVCQPQGDVRILRRIARDLLQLHPVHRELALALADQFRRRHFTEAEHLQCEAIDAVGDPARIDEKRRHHGVQRDPAQRDAGAAHHQQIVFDVVPDFRNRRVFQDWPNRIENRGAGQKVRTGRAADRHVITGRFFPTKAHADEIGIQRAQRIGLRIESKSLLPAKLRKKGFKLLLGLHQLVTAIRAGGDSILALGRGR